MAYARKPEHRYTPGKTFLVFSDKGCLPYIRKEYVLGVLLRFRVGPRYRDKATILAGCTHDTYKERPYSRSDGILQIHI